MTTGLYIKFFRRCCQVINDSDLGITVDPSQLLDAALDENEN